MNSINMIGYVSSDLELKYVGKNNSEVCNFDLAVKWNERKDETGKAYTDFISCEIWGKKAVALVNHSAKGKKLGVTGELHTSQYVDGSGIKRKRYFVLVNETEIIEWSTSQGNVVENENAYEGSIYGEEK